MEKELVGKVKVNDDYFEGVLDRYNVTAPVQIGGDVTPWGVTYFDIKKIPIKDVQSISKMCLESAKVFYTIENTHDLKNILKCLNVIATLKDFSLIDVILENHLEFSVKVEHAHIVDMLLKSFKVMED